MEENDISEIKKSISKLEKKGGNSLWLQFLIFPLILGCMGFWFQSSIKETENKMQRLKMTQAILGDIFTDTIYERTVAMKSVLYEILDDEKIASKISAMVDAHLSKTAKEADLTKFNEVFSAIENYSKPGDSLLENLKNSSVVISKLNKTQMAKNMEREGFNYLASGNLEAAKLKFKTVDSIYPTYHQAWEIYRYLDKNQNNFDNQEEIRKIQEHTIRKLNYGAPKDLMIKIENQIQDRASN